MGKIFKFKTFSLLIKSILNIQIQHCDKKLLKINVKLFCSELIPLLESDIILFQTYF